MQRALAIACRTICSMTADQVQLQTTNVRGRNPYVTKSTETSIDTVAGFIGFGGRGHKLRRVHNSGASFPGKSKGRIATSDDIQIIDRERLTIDFHQTLPPSRVLQYSTSSLLIARSSHHRPPLQRRQETTTDNPPPQGRPGSSGISPQGV